MAADTELVPYREEVVEEDRKLSTSWQSFFRTIQDIIFYVGKEKSFVLVNNQAVAANIEGLIFDKSHYSQAIVEYLIQRVTSGVELIESGRIVAIFSPNTAVWNIIKISDISVGAIGVTISITSSGQVEYATSNIAGTGIFSRIVYRLRQLEGKTSVYSRMG